MNGYPVVVLVNYGSGAKVPVPPEMRAAIDALERGHAPTGT